MNEQKEYGLYHSPDCTCGCKEPKTVKLIRVTVTTRPDTPDAECEAMAEWFEGKAKKALEDIADKVSRHFGYDLEVTAVSVGDL